MTGLARLCLATADNANQKKSIRQYAATATRNIEADEGSIGGKKQGTFDISEVQFLVLIDFSKIYILAKCDKMNKWFYICTAFANL